MLAEGLASRRGASSKRSAAPGVAGGPLAETVHRHLCGRDVGFGGLIVEEYGTIALWGAL